MKKLHPFLAIAAALLNGGCGDSSYGPDDGNPGTPEEMYARVQELLQPDTMREGPAREEALKWLLRAGEAGHLQAQTDLGGLYLEGGEGVKANGATALYWFRKAAEQGHVQSLVFIGRILYQGMDVPADKPAALACWEKAAATGLPEAHFSLAQALYKQPEQAGQVVAHLREAANGSGRVAAEAATLLGFIYNKGLGDVAPDARESAHWYELAAKAGDPKSQLVYAVMLLTGEGFPKDEKAGMTYLRLSAGQDYPQAIALLINQLRNGDTHEANDAEAAAWEKRLESLRVK